MAQITHYITPDTPPDLIKVVLWTTDLLYARQYNSKQLTFVLTRDIIEPFALKTMNSRLKTIYVSSHPEVPASFDF